VDCSGQSSAVADFNLLDTARKVELYGIQMHSAKVVYLRCAEFSCLTTQDNRKTIEHNIRYVFKKTYKRWQLALHCPLRPPVSPVILSFSHKDNNALQHTKFLIGQST